MTYAFYAYVSHVEKRIFSGQFYPILAQTYVW